jgi:hypothetical protein
MRSEIDMLDIERIHDRVVISWIANAAVEAVEDHLCCDAYIRNLYRGDKLLVVKL